MEQPPTIRIGYSVHTDANNNQIALDSFSGHLLDLKLYDHALSQNEVKGMYDGERQEYGLGQQVVPTPAPTTWPTLMPVLPTPAPAWPTLMPVLPTPAPAWPTLMPMETWTELPTPFPWAMTMMPEPSQGPTAIEDRKSVV